VTRPGAQRGPPLGDPLPSLLDSEAYPLCGWCVGIRAESPDATPSYEVDTSAAMLVLLNAGSPPPDRRVAVSRPRDHPCPWSSERRAEMQL